MSPEQIAALSALLTMISRLSGWPFGVLIFLFFIGPWLLAVMLAYSYRRKYESNVRLVEDYNSIAGDLKDVVMLNTQTLTTLIADVRTNQYCPQVRLKKIAGGRTDDGN
ncbi:MAG: hypothetical protein P1P89_13900 [Desulfobacterales bacterium]|nr:hypothetical protein [Desulfobacterales bacterium]